MGNESGRGRMRRANKAMDTADAIAFLRGSWAARIGTVGADGYPYVVPVNIAYKDPESGDGPGTVYFHCALEGHKLDNIAHNPKVCIQADDGGKPVTGDKPCDYSTTYVSVVAFGTARIVGDPKEHLGALRLIAGASGAPAGMAMDERVLARTRVVAIDIEIITGKRSG